MQRLVVCAFTVLAVGAIGACSSDNGVTSAQGAFDSAVMAVDSSPVLLHVYRNPADTIPKSDTAHFQKLPFYLPADHKDRTPTVTVLPQNAVVPNGADNVSASFSDPTIADFDGDGFIEGLAPGSTVLTYTLTDFNHGNVTQSINIPITVALVAAPARLIH